MSVAIKLQKPKTFNLSGLADKWPSSHLARSQSGIFSGNMVTPKTMANEDSRGTGIESRFLCGNKIIYPVNDFIAWLEARVSKPKQGKIGT